MPDELEKFMLTQRPTSERPLLGLTALVVEDSRFACEAMRLLCLRSGARIRRADSLKSAHRHLSVYRPVVVIVDLGLPDGSGAELIATLATAVPKVPVILGTSGNSESESIALHAGADGFLEKPVTSLAAFQTAVLRHLPRSRRPKIPREVRNDMISPDPLALREDLIHVCDILADAATDDQLASYAAQFLSSLARLAGDTSLETAARSLEEYCRRGNTTPQLISGISELLQDHLRNTSSAIG